MSGVGSKGAEERRKEEEREEEEHGMDLKREPTQRGVVGKKHLLLYILGTKKPQKKNMLGHLSHLSPILAHHGST